MDIKVQKYISEYCFKKNKKLIKKMGLGISV